MSILGLGNPGGVGILGKGGARWARWGEMQGSVYEQPKGEVDGSHHSKEGSKYVEEGNKGSKGNIVYITYSRRGMYNQREKYNQ